MSSLKKTRLIPTAPADEPNPNLSLVDRFTVLKKPDPQCHVIVVGAGLAGLSAAYELESVGYRVTVLEARPTLGGRVESRRDIVPNKVMEGGAELIGRNHLAWWAYKYKFGLKLDPVPSSSNPVPVILGGERLTSRKAAKLGREMARVQRLISKAAKQVNADEPWKSLDAARLDRMSLVEGLSSLPMSDRCRLAFFELLQTDNGVPADRQSWLGNLAMIKGGGLSKYWTDTETHQCRGGNQKLAFAFQDALTTIFLRKTVKAIEIHETGVAVTVSNGKIIAGTDAVLATPPTMWKKISLSPPLPKSCEMQFGQNVKYLLNVKNEFWDPDNPESSSDGPVDLTWLGTDATGPRAGLVAFSGSDDAAICRSWKNKHRMYLQSLSSIYQDVRTASSNGLFMDWPGQKWTLGSYSFPKPGEIMRVGPRIRKGFRRYLHFAGEHTCYSFTGYMEGALQSGLRVAEQIARRDGVIT